MEIKKLHTFQAKMLICSILIFILSLIVLFTKIPGVILLPFIIICGIYFFRYLDLYMNLEKHEKAMFKLIKNPLFIDNRIWLNNGDYSELFKAIKSYCKKYKTKIILLRLQLDEIEQLKHKLPDDDSFFEKAKGAIDFIEGLQKDKVLTIRGLGLAKIKKLEGDTNSEDNLEKKDTLDVDGVEYKNPAIEGRYKSKLAEGIKKLLIDEFSDNLKQINLMSDTPEIRVRVRAYAELINDIKVDIVDIKKVTKSAEYVNKYTPKTIDDELKNTKYAKYKKAQEAKKKAMKEKIDFVTKDIIK